MVYGPSRLVYHSSRQEGCGTIEGWFITALALSAAGYGVYLVGLRRHLVEPNRASWLIWSAATGIEAATYAAVNPGAPQGWVFALSAIACVAVTLVMWRRSRWRSPSPPETFCMAAALAALLLWLLFRETFWAHMLVVAAVPVSFWPTWASVREDRARERSPAWGLWTLGDLATLVLATRGVPGEAGANVGELAYVFVELLCHAAVWIMIGLPSINPLRSLGRAWGDGGGLVLVDALARGGNPFAVTEGPIGKAVVATRGFAAGERIVRFGGPVLRAADVPRQVEGRNDRYVQIGHDRWLGPSGRIDDLFNHSCAPNAGLTFGEGVTLVALRAIAPGEEIAWDYATTVGDPSWRMPCGCGATACRGMVGPFGTLPETLRDWYLERGLVAPHLAEAEERERRVAAA